MTRKEMINLISDNVLSSFLPNVELRVKNLIADCVLAECEKAGMLPPQLRDDLKSYVIGAFPLKRVGPLCFYDWEIENERLKKLEGK